MSEYKKAAKFYEGSPDGQYDELAAHALNSHEALIESLESIVGKIYGYCATGAKTRAIAKAHEVLKLAKGEE